MSTAPRKVTYEWLSKSQMTIDPRVQRTLNPRQVQKIANQFDANGLGVCTVSRRDSGVNVVLDGQTRVAGAELAGYDGRFYCAVHHGLILKEEAALFLELNNQTVVTAFSSFLVRIKLADIVIWVITSAWGLNPKGVNANIVKGLGQLFGRFGSAVDARRLATQLQAVTPVGLMASARQLQELQKGLMPAAIAKMLVGIHNKGLRVNLLPDWQWIR